MLDLCEAVSVGSSSGERDDGVLPGYLERGHYLGLGLGSLDTVLSNEPVSLRESQSLSLQQVLQAVLLTLNNTVAGTQMMQSF